MNASVTWRNAFLVGTVCAILEALLLWIADSTVDRWVFTQSILFWLGCGMVVSMADSGLPALWHGIVLTVLLNLPWYIVLAIAPGNWAILLPLVIASIIFGTMIGWLRGKFKESRID